MGFRLFRFFSVTQNFEIDNIAAKIISEAIPSFSWPKLSFNQSLIETKFQSIPLKGEDERQINI